MGTERHVLAFDPGATIGWSHLQSARGTDRPKLVACGSDRWDQEKFANLVREFARTPDPMKVLMGMDVPIDVDAVRVPTLELLVAIESEPPGQSKKAHKVRKGGREVDISGALQDMMRVAGLLEGIAVGLGLRVVHEPAVRWRRWLCATATPTDAQIKRMVTMVVADLPKRTNEHERDATGCAYAALTRPRFVP